MTTLDPKTTDTADSATSLRSTGTKATRAIGIAATFAMGWLVLFGLVLSPADVNQGESVRLLYIHVPTIWIAYLSFIVTAVASGMYLFTKKHSLAWDRLAGASAESGGARWSAELGRMPAQRAPRRTGCTSAALLQSTTALEGRKTLAENASSLSLPLSDPRKTT